MVKLTAELLLRSDAYLNPLKDRELDLRGQGIPAIENLGVTKDQLESIDFTDNSISSISNLPSLKRLKHLLLANNPVHTISPMMPTALPNLISLVLTGSQMKELKDLDPLGHCKRLEFLSLKDTPVSEQPYYRLWLIFRCKALRVLDNEKVKDKERAEARSLFLQPDSTELSQLALSISSSAAAPPPKRIFQPGAATTAGGEKGRLLTDEERLRVRKAIETASSVEEMRRLRRMLDEGHVPQGSDIKSAPRGSDAMQQ